MTQRGRTHWTTLGHESPSVYELSTRGFKCQNSPESSDEEQSAASDIPALQNNEYDGGNDIRDTDNTVCSGCLKRVFTFMSKSLLLRRSHSGQGLRTCDALRDQAPSSSNHSSDFEGDELDDVRRKR